MKDTDIRKLNQQNRSNHRCGARDLTVIQPHAEITIPSYFYPEFLVTSRDLVMPFRQVPPSDARHPPVVSKTSNVSHLTDFTFS